MRSKIADLAVLYVLAACLILLRVCQCVLGFVGPEVLLLAVVFVLVIFPMTLLLARRMLAAERGRRMGHAALSWLVVNLALLAHTWRCGEFRLLTGYLPVLFVGQTLPLVVYWLVARALVTQQSASEPPPEASDSRQATSMLMGCLFTVFATAGLLFCFMVPVSIPENGIDIARVTSMKLKGRLLWLAILDANMANESKDISLLWPRDLGFTGDKTSTDYFRRLFSNDAGQVVEWDEGRVAPTLGLSALGGHVLSEAASAEAFGPENNAWQVVCIGEDAPAGAPFLISRNVDFGDTLTPTSQVRFIRSGPLTLRRVVWVTRGGGCFDAAFKRFKSELLFRDADGDPAPTVPSTGYRVMRP